MVSRGAADPVASGVLRLRDLRKRRGIYASEAAASAEIERILEELGGGIYRRLFTEMEIEGRSVKEAARTLGVCERQVYRLRRRMVQRLNNVFAPPVCLPVISNQECYIESAREAFERGQAALARTLLTPLLKQRLSPEIAARAWALGSGIAIDCGDTGEARAALREAKRASAQSACDPASADVLMAQSYAAFTDAAYGPAVSAAERAAALFAASDSVLHARDAMRTLLFLAVVHQENGTSVQALGALDRAEAVLRRLPLAPIREHAQLSILRAIALSARAPELHGAFAYASKAIEAARWHNLVHESIWATYAYAYALLSAGRMNEAAPYAQTVFSTARDVIGGHHRARMHLMLARIALSSGRYDTAQKHVERAKSAGAQHRRMQIIASVCETRITRATANAGAALNTANRCLERFDGTNQSYHKGVAYLVRADAQWKAGVRPIDDCERALHHLRNGGMPCDRVDALDLYYRITKKPRFFKEAQEIRAAIDRDKTITNKSAASV